MTPDLFPDTKPPRAKPRVLMHVIDAGGEGAHDVMALMQCAKCGAESEWLSFKNVTEVKRGIPCPECNK